MEVVEQSFGVGTNPPYTLSFDGAEGGEATVLVQDFNFPEADLAQQVDLI